MDSFEETATRVSCEASCDERVVVPFCGSAVPPAFSRRAFVAVAACTVAGVLAGCGSKGAPEETLQQDDPCPYQWNDLIWDGGRPVYRVNDQILSRWGVDVSEHQLEVDWDSVADAGATFAFVRIGNRGATKGTLGVDEYFMRNVTGATAAGIPVSAYFFSQSINENEAREEANFALDQIHQAEAQGIAFNMIAYDHEVVDINGARANNLSPEQFAANARAFCEVIEEAGYAPMIYGNQQDLLRLTVSERRQYPLWLAEYGIDEPTVDFNFAIWQYTSEGEVPGISVPADLNVWFETA